MNGLRDMLAMALTAGIVTTAGIGAYDVLVRQPRTPRLAVVDITRLFTAAEQRAKARVLTGGLNATAAGPSGPGPTATAADSGPNRSSSGADVKLLSQASELAGMLAVDEFGPALERVLAGLSGECRCAIVAMAAVVGDTAAIPDYTAEVASRLRLALPAELQRTSAR